MGYGNLRGTFCKKNSRFLKRHTSLSGMPHLNETNATLHGQSSVAFPPLKCGIPDDEVRHLFR